jgi:NAD(P)H dehydrogenase (quinone)
MDEIHGGSAYGAGTFSKGDGSRQPTQLELQLAESQGSHLTQIATALKIGRAALPAKEASPPDPKYGERPASSSKK